MMLSSKSFQSKVEAALYYTVKGWQVFPLNWVKDGACSCKNAECHSPGKHPLTRNGLKDATGDKKQIAKWWHEFPDANIGVRTGEISGIFVVDLDKKTGIDGETAYKLLAGTHKTPLSAGQDTGSGGSHLIYKYPDFEVRNTANLYANGQRQNGIDIRGQEGYIVAAPSNHISGGSYKYYDLEVAEAPNWLLAILRNQVTPEPQQKVTFEKPESTRLTDEEKDAIIQALTDEWGIDLPEENTSHRPIIEGISVLFKRHGISEEETASFLLSFNEEHLCADKKKHSPRDIKRYVKDCYAKEYKVSREMPKRLFARVMDAFRLRDTTEIWISREDGIRGKIFNGAEGKISVIARKKVYDEHRHAKKDEHGNTIYEQAEDVIAYFRGEISKPLLFNGKPAIEFELQGEEKQVMGIAETVQHFKALFSLSGSKAQRLREMLDAWISEKIKSGEIEEYHSSPILVDKEGIIRCDYQPDKGNKEILSALVDYQENATSPDGFRAALAFNLVAPLFSEIKGRSTFMVQTPYNLASGLSHTGKSPMLEFFVGHGFGQNREHYYYSVERVKSAFMMGKHFGHDNLPKLIDEIYEAWFLSVSGALKAYSQSNHFSDRGKGDQGYNQYLGLSGLNFATNMNQRVDADLGISNRFIHTRYGPQELARVDRNAFLEFRESLPQGFMFGLFNELFGNKHIDEVIEQVSRFEYGYQWVHNILYLLNGLCRKYRIPEFGEYEAREDFSDSNAMEVAQEFLAEWGRIQANTSKWDDQNSTHFEHVKYRSRIEGAFKVDDKENRKHIHFTASAFKILTGPLKLPYTSASDFVNNIKSSKDGVNVENGGKTKGKKINGTTVYVYELSVPNVQGVE